MREAGSVQEDGVSVEFGPTQIGEMSYICPLRGVAMTKTFAMYPVLDAQPRPTPIDAASTMSHSPTIPYSARIRASSTGCHRNERQ